MDKMIDSDSVDMGSIPVEATINKNNSLVISELFFIVVRIKLSKHYYTQIINIFFPFISISSDFHSFISAWSKTTK